MSEAFARKATGLVREIGFVTSILITICFVIGLGWQKRAFQVVGWAPIPETAYLLGIPPIVMAFLIGGIVVILTIFVFGMLVASMPRSGGGYVYVSRILSPGWALVAGWSELFGFGACYGAVAACVAEVAIMFGGIAGLYRAEMFLTPEWILFFGAVILGATGLAAALGVRMAGRLLQTVFWIPFAILIVLWFSLAIATPEMMESGIVAITGHSAIEYTRAALDQGMREAAAGIDYWGAVSVAMLGAYWAYIGYTGSTFVAGEVKEAHKALPRSLAMAGFIIMIWYMFTSTLMSNAARMVGVIGDYSFFSAWGFLSYGKGSLAAAGLPVYKAWLPVTGMFMWEAMGWHWALGLLVIFSALFVFNDLPPFYLCASRLVFAMSFDRVFPERLMDVNERWHSPLKAVAFVFALGMLGVVAESDIFKYLGPWDTNLLWRIVGSSGTIETADMWDGIFFLLVCIAGLLFPYRRRDIYEKSPFRRAVAGVPVISIVAAMATIGQLYFIYTFMTNPFEALNPWGWAEGFWTTVAILVIGALIYYYYKTKAKRTGVDLTAIYTEIPPE